MVDDRHSGEQATEEAEQNDAAQGAERSSRLTRKEWIDAAWNALAHGSIETVKVDRLAKDLGVTRGSFYYHFSNRDDLLDAVLDRWLRLLGLQQAIAPHITALSEPEEKLWAVYDYVIRNINGPQSLFLRIWARKSGPVLARMRKEDDERKAHYASLFREMGFDADEASLRAEMYFGLVMSEFLRNGAQPLDERLRQGRAQHAFLLQGKPSAAGMAKGGTG
jgi:AcrR family transcriptional regulator